MKYLTIKTISIILWLCPAVCPAADGPDLNVKPAARSHTEIIKGSGAKFTIDVNGRTPPVNRSIEITGPAEDVRIKLEGGLDFSSMESLAASLGRPGMTDEEKVKACFYYAVNNFYDRGSSGCEDPLEYASLWGYSFCGNYALFLNAVWTAAGFPSVFLNPVIGMQGGHTITSVYYDNQWHMFDSRLRGYFLNRDNRTIASLVDLDRDDSLLRRGLDYSNHMVGHWNFYTLNYNYINSASDWYDGFNAHFDNKTLFNRDCPKWDSSLSLREGEILTLEWGNRGKWWNRKDLSPRWLELHTREGLESKTVPPLIYANGTLEFNVDPRHYKKQALEFSGIRSARGASPVFRPAAAKQEGSVIYQVRAPYFIPSMRLQAGCFLKTNNDSAAVEISPDEGKTWQSLWKAVGGGKLQVDVSTDRTQQVTWYSPNKYSYLIRFNLFASRSPADATIGDIRILTDLYYRPIILPALKPGLNRLLYSDRSRGRHKRQVTFNWLEDTNILLSEDRPCIGDEVALTALVVNSGHTEARNVTVRFYDGDPALGGEQIGGDQVIPVIEPGATGKAEVLWEAVQRQVDAVEGVSIAFQKKISGYTHNTLFVRVDPEGRIAEKDENNNLTSRQVTVYNQANLVLMDPSFVTFDRKENEIRITALVRNHNLSGHLARAREARDVVVRFYDGQPIHGRLEGDNLIGEAVIPAIDPGEFGAARVDWDVTGLQGRRLVFVIVDPEDRIKESWQHKPGIYMQIKKEIILE
jgi:CARDB protein